MDLESFKLKTLSALIAYDKRMLASERRRGHVPNHNRLAILCGGLNEIHDAVKAGQDPRKAILARACGRFADCLLKAAGLPLMTRDEARS